MISIEKIRFKTYFRTTFLPGIDCGWKPRNCYCRSKVSFNSPIHSEFFMILTSYITSSIENVARRSKNAKEREVKEFHITLTMNKSIKINEHQVT